MREKVLINSHCYLVFALALCTFTVALSLDFDNNYRDVCSTNVNCSCINSNSTEGDAFFVICEGVIYLELTSSFHGSIDLKFLREIIFGRSNHRWLHIRCLSHDLIDYNEYTSLVYYNYKWRNENDILDIELHFNNCSLPTRGFASMLSPDLGNSSLSSLNNEIRLYNLSIDCMNAQNIQLTRNHLRGLVHLKFFQIECQSLTNLQEDTFRDVAGTLEIVEIRFTAISEIPRTLFHNMTRLYELRLSDNKLKFIHKYAFVGLNIKKIYLENNHIQVLDGLFSHSRHFWIINIQSNNIIHLPIVMGGCNEVTNFNASNNRIKCISEKHFEGMTSLTHLYLSLNNISYIHPKAFSNTAYLSELHLNGNSLGRYTSRYSECFNSSSSSEGPESDEGKQSLMPLDEGIFSNNKELQTIDLSENFIDSLPENIFSNNKNLMCLRLQSNNISSLPKKLLQNNFQLEELNLANNNIVEIPVGFLNSQSEIKHLYLDRNKLTSFDKDLLSNSSRLEVFDVHSNKIKSLPIELFDRCNGSLRILNLSYNQLTSFPKFFLPELTSLNLANNNLSIIENETFHEMSKLQSLNLACNIIHTIDSYPIYLGSQPLLTLDISNNKLSGIDEEWFPKRPRYELYQWISSEITDIKLKSFNFSGNNKLSNVPILLFAIEELDLSRMSEKPKWYNLQHVYTFHYYFSSKLKILNLSHNRLRSFNNEYDWDHKRRMVGIEFVFYWLVSLEVLNLSHNEIDAIPLELRTDLPNLRVLDLSHNRIKYLHRDDFLVYKGFTYSFNLPIQDRYLETFSIYQQLKEFRQKWSNERGEIFQSLVVDLRHNLIEGMDLNTENENAPLFLVNYEVRENNPRSVILIHFMALVPKVHWRNELYSHATYLLGHNPIFCGCNVLNLISYSLEEMRPVGELERVTGKRKYLPAKVDIDDLSCHMPESVRGKRVSEPESWMYHLLPLYGMCKLMTVEVIEQ